MSARKSGVPPRIDTGPLAGAFRDMTASYKAFWFLALVEVVKERSLRSPLDFVIPFDELAEGMLDAAFWPAVTYRLSFGSQDQLHRKLAVYRSDDGNEEKPSLAGERVRGFLRYVPHAFLALWIAPERAGGKNPSIDEMASVPGRIPYRITKTGIVVDPFWFDHIADNLGVMRALGERELIRFLQSRNPTVPGIPDKIDPPDRGGGLGAQKRFWNSAQSGDDPTCFYSGVSLKERAFSLDHFVPWSFVAHNRIWNLVPMATSLNSSKGVRLPDVSLVDRIGEAHFAVVRSARKSGDDAMGKWLAEYEADLRIDMGSIDEAGFRGAHRDTILPLMALARRTGFSGSWSQPSARLVGGL